MTDAFPSASSYAIYRVGDHAPAGQPIDHPPAQARVAFERAAAHGRDELRIRIAGYDSPAVAERLADGAGHAPRIEDWRSMVDSVAIDPSYDGRVLRVSLADAPARKADLVAGSYALDTPSGETTAAVRIIDVLGEETLIVQRV